MRGVARPVVADRDGAIGQGFAKLRDPAFAVARDVDELADLVANAVSRPWVSNS
jgi:hypothetical protein